jgi:hypothetical protein
MGVAIVLNLLFLLPSLQAPVDARPVDCTFSNPQYAGDCVEQVTPTENQTPVQACRVILDCLNNTQCVKTYCQNTTIRGGWTLESAKASGQ